MTMMTMKTPSFHQVCRGLPTNEQSIALLYSSSCPSGNTMLLLLIKSDLQYLLMVVLTLIMRNISYATLFDLLILKVDDVNQVPTHSILRLLSQPLWQLRASRSPWRPQVRELPEWRWSSCSRETRDAGSVWQRPSITPELRFCSMREKSRN